MQGENVEEADKSDGDSVIAAETNDEQGEGGLQTVLRPVLLANGTERAGAIVLDLSGEVDLSTVPVLKQALAEAVDRSRNSGAVAGGDIIVNMADVNYMDSSGYGTLLGANKQMRPRGGRIHLTGCNPSILRMLEITRLDALFVLHNSEQAAVASLAAAGAPSQDEAPDR